MPDQLEPESHESAVDRLIDAAWLERMAAWLSATGRRLWERRRSLGPVVLPVPIVSVWRRLRPAPINPRTGSSVELNAARRLVPRRAHVATAAVVLLILVFGYLADCVFEIPTDGGVSGDATGSGVLVQAADGSELATRGTPRGEKLTADEIPQVLKTAIVAIEDRRFFSHGALDPHGMARAIFRDVLRGRGKEGASTLTQQLARLTLLSPDRTLKRKVQEAMIALWLEHHLSKQEILGRYLNAAYFGAGAYGVDAAAQRYFGKSARDLTLPEAAMMAGLVRAPSQLAPHRNLEAAQTRATLVLRAMVETGVASQADADAARAHPATLKVLPETPSGSGYAVDVAAGDIKALVGNAAVDVTASTTIVPAMQELAERVIDRYLEGEGVRKNIGQAALVALGPDGAILAMVGGRDYDDSGFNRATMAKRQVGSLFKLFVYLTALRQGATPDTTVVDQPVEIGDWQPHNFEKGYRGAIPLHLAFAHSLNTVAAQLGQKVGIPTVIKTAHELGVTSDLPNVPSLALGTAGISLMEMTRAYATVASDQDSVEPFLVRRIASGDKVLFNRPQQYAGDTEPDAAKLAMRELLSDVVREGTGRAAQLAVPTGGKTGTTQDFRDAWFIGSGPDITVGVWTGNDDNSPMNGVTGGDVPAKIWHDFVADAEKILGARRTAAAKKSVVAVPAAASKTAPAPIVEAAAETKDADRDKTGAITGDADVTDTASFDIDGRPIRLQGVAPVTGRPVRSLARYLRRREVVCTPAAGATYRCTVDGDDLATTILTNGGSPATDDAPADLLAAQQGAQAARRGIWRRRR
ncbi:transglycosylase domain-containing protein [Beijerinckia sp. L45]|uniref:transglycosylase domain-containing protein n=1 Tax=Beijerinckia sp. L45 TaxID=1641855 RepID=UPI00131C05F3|nr:PBP1A family penicillin-binding protein [Beijerinckia sp. L45]